MALKALILAGGLGTRLRPLSCTRSKLLFPIANRPILDLILEKLATGGVDEAILAVNFMADAIEQAFGGSKYGITLRYSRDEPPRAASSRSSGGALGTGGPVKQAEKLLGREEAFFVLNGDILTNTNYGEIMEEHRKNEGIGTIALHQVRTPQRYGVVELTERNRISRFVEKPSEEPPSNLVNAGIYVFTPDIFDYIPTGKKCSIEREIFPRLVKERTLFGYEITGLWIDVGKPADYIQANRLWLEAGAEGGVVSVNAQIGKQVKLKPAVAIGAHAIVKDEAIIGPNVALGKGVSIGPHVRIRNAIVFPRTTISDYSTIEGAVIGESVSIGKNVRIQEGCLIGDNAVINEGLTLTKNVKVWPAKQVTGNILTPRSIT
jgi:mannose-1-phosphate guanylyltransferase